MNSRNSVNETNLVNFSAELPRLPQLDTKDGLLSFPFDHIYACHSQSSDRRQAIQLEKEVEVSTHCVVGDEKNISGPVSDISRLSEQLNVTESQNRKLKELLIYHLDLIQQQNELITKRDKLYQALKQENDTLKSKLIRMDRKELIQHQQLMNSILSPPNATVTSSVLKKEHGLPQDTTLSFGIARTTIDPDELPEVPKLMSSDLKTPGSNRDYKMIDNKRSLVKKEPKSRSDALYTVTSNSGNTIIQRIQRNRRRSSGIGSLSRMTRTPKTNIPETVTSNKKKTTEPEPSLGRMYCVNKKSKPVNTYGKSRSTITPKKTVQYTGSLSDRLQLIDTTPTGEDPYQLGEADMREQSPIPKLMLQKTNHGRMKVMESVGESTRRIYDRPNSKNKNLNRFMSTYDEDKKEEDDKNPMLLEEADIELIKTEPDIDWQVYTENLGNDSSLCDFSFGESSNQMLPSLDANEFQELFTSDAALNLDNLNQLDYPTEKVVPEKTKKRGARTSSLVAPAEEEGVESKRGNDSRRGRKRALSATGLGKQTAKTTTKPKAPKGKAAARGKKSPVPSLMTDKPYHTLVCDPDLSWYLGLDPDLKLEDVDPPAETQASTVEVPRWREKPYTSSYTLEGTENVDDKVFEKRHQKLEAEERRQLRWHMRRIREQRHVERLRQRQRDSWNSTVTAPSVYTVWPRPQDARFIEITDDLPVTGFGEPMPQLPQSDFMLPWVRTSKALKRSKRSKTHS